MKISATDAGQAETALIFSEEEGALGRWLLLDSGAVIVRGGAGEPLPSTATAVLAVPGEQVSIHWLELAEGLAPAQAAAAARLLLADASAEPTADLHVAVGRSEQGRTPVALVPVRQMTEWLQSAAAVGLDPDILLPTYMLLAPPAEGFARRDRGSVTDYRAAASAFSLEPELADVVLKGAACEPMSLERFEADLAPILADPPINLRQGPFARRRSWRAEAGPLRRVAGWALALILLTLAVQVTMILRYTFDADALEAEGHDLAALGGRSGNLGFGTIAGALFDAIQGTPNVELTRIEYRPDGVLTASLQADSPASLAALEQRMGASGLDVEVGVPRSAGGRPVAELTVRP